MNSTIKNTPLFRNPKIKWFIAAYLVLFFGGVGVALLLGVQVPVVMWWRVFLYSFMFFGVVSFFFLSADKPDAGLPPVDRDPTAP